jgi:universal stress protein A
MAIVGDNRWTEWMTKVAELFMQGEVRHYKMTQLLEALRWINDEGEEDEEKEQFPFSE